MLELRHQRPTHHHTISDESRTKNHVVPKLSETNKKINNTFGVGSGQLMYLKRTENRLMYLVSLIKNFKKLIEI